MTSGEKRSSGGSTLSNRRPRGTWEPQSAIVASLRSVTAERNSQLSRNSEHLNREHPQGLKLFAQRGTGRPAARKLEASPHRLTSSLPMHITVR